MLGSEPRTLYEPQCSELARIWFRGSESMMSEAREADGWPGWVRASDRLGPSLGSEARGRTYDYEYVSHSTQGGAARFTRLNIVFGLNLAVFVLCGPSLGSEPRIRGSDSVLSSFGCVVDTSCVVRERLGGDLPSALLSP